MYGLVSITDSKNVYSVISQIRFRELNKHFSSPNVTNIDIVILFT